MTMTEPAKSRFFTGLVIDTSPLRTSAAFRRIFIARTISIFGLGMLAVAVPMQIFELTGSTLQVGIAATVEGLCAFAGLLVGGDLADRFDRRKIILYSRMIGGTGFAVLAVNAWLSEPSVAAIYVVGGVDGFFGALSVTALMAVTPTLVPRDKLAAAGALNMLTVRLGTMASPALGGVIIAAAGVGWTYAGAAAATLLTITLLTGLPSLKPDMTGPRSHPLLAAAQGAAFVYRQPVVRAVVVLGTLETMASGIRIMLPALGVVALGVGAQGTGLLYAAVPCGAVVATLFSGWIGQARRPGWAMALFSIASFVSLAALGFSRDLASALMLLTIFGALSSLSGILQYALVQAHTPDHLLGRVNALWMAQEVGSDSVGALGLGGLGRAVPATMAVLIFGTAATVLGTAGLLGFGALRRTGALDASSPQRFDADPAQAVVSSSPASAKP
ncbi:enterobactin transporter EntS [Arthrobacter glacialis]|nr:enterobactin transporter EntS [Arthrobacter glacialis]